MNREQLLLASEQQRSQAKVLTRRGDLARAHAILGGLIEMLEVSLVADEEAESSSVKSRLDVARALADTYGMLGGVEWRQGKLIDALRSYGSGRALEQSEEFDLSESYNLVNFLVVSILINPANLGELKADLDDAIIMVRGQVNGQRRDQWWAWADYALLCVLASDVESALVAYDRFFECGPTRSNYQAVRRVLEDLRQNSSAAGSDLYDVIVPVLEYIDRRSSRL